MLYKTQISTLASLGSYYFVMIQHFKHMVAKIKVKVMQKALVGAFCITFDLYKGSKFYMYSKQQGFLIQVCFMVLDTIMYYFEKHIILTCFIYFNKTDLQLLPMFGCPNKQNNKYLFIFHCSIFSFLAQSAKVSYFIVCMEVRG